MHNTTSQPASTPYSGHTAVSTGNDARATASTSVRALVAYLVIGTLFGILFTKAEVISWFRIQEMFRFQSFHMYGIIGSAVAVAAVSVWLIKRLGIRTFGARHWLGCGAIHRSGGEYREGGAGG